MKKNILSLLLVCFFVSLRLFAQSQIKPADLSDNLTSSRATTAYRSDVKAEAMDTVFRAGMPAVSKGIINNRLSPAGSATENRSFDISEAYPNPAATSTSLEYTIPEGSNARLMLRNLTGRIVRVVNLEKSDGRIVISTNDLKDGLYFYSFLLNNKVEVTRKLVIKH